PVIPCEVGHASDVKTVIARSGSDEAIQIFHRQGWIGSLSLAMTQNGVPATRMASGLAEILAPPEGAGNAGRLARPQPRVRIKKARRVSPPRASPKRSGIPRAARF